MYSEEDRYNQILVYIFASSADWFERHFVIADVLRKTKSYRIDQYQFRFFIKFNDNFTLFYNTRSNVSVLELHPKMGLPFNVSIKLPENKNEVAVFKKSMYNK